MTISTAAAAPAADAAAAPPRPFPRVFWAALGLEFLERLAFYGVYVNLSVYLTGTVGLGDVENGTLLGVFVLVRSLVPMITGTLADRIGFRRSLVMSFALYIGAYLVLFFAPSRAGAWAAVMGMAVGGAFLKPVIPATVRRYAPAERRAVGFAYFYQSVNAGSVVGKVATTVVRLSISLRASMLNAVIACAAGLVATLAGYREPAPDDVDAAVADQPAAPPSPFAGIARALTQPRLLAFLVLMSGYYLLIEQFYQTFPPFIVRVHGDQVQREPITLINPLVIALLQGFVGRLTSRIRATTAIPIGVLIGSASMLVMGSVPTLAGPCLSFFVFAFAEMILAPRYYEYISSFAPKGSEGTYMGLAILPVGFGGLVGGVLSGRLIAAYLPKVGPRDPLAVWGVYALIGLACAASLAVFARVTRRATEAEGT